MVRRSSVAVGIAIVIASFATHAQGQTQAPPPAQAAPPPANAYPPPGYGYPPPGYGYPPPGYGYPPPGYGYPPRPGYPSQGVVAALRPGYHKHDGFYLSAQAGVAYMSMSTSAPEVTMKLSGAGSSFSFGAGAAVVENVVLFGTFLGASALNPNLQLDGTSQGTSNRTTTLYGLGGGAAYYIVPANIYVAGSLLASWIGVSGAANQNVAETKVGASFAGLVGKEWWVSSNWGLGLALQVLYGRMEDQSIAAPGSTWTAAGASFLFSATYN